MVSCQWMQLRFRVAEVQRQASAVVVAVSFLAAQVALESPVHEAIRAAEARAAGNAAGVLGHVVVLVVSAPRTSIAGHGYGYVLGTLFGRRGDPRATWASCPWFILERLCPSGGDDIPNVIHAAPKRP